MCGGGGHAKAEVMVRAYFDEFARSRTRACSIVYNHRRPFY